MATYATADDVAARWRPLSESEAAIAERWLDDAEGMAFMRFPTLMARLQAGLVEARVMESVLVRTVLRVLRNPDGKVTETIDDYSYRRADALADGSLYISAEDAALLQPAAQTSGAFSIRARREARIIDARWPL